MASPYLNAQAQNGAATPYMVHVLLDEAVPLDRAALVRGFEARLGSVVPVDPDSDALHFALPDYPSRIGNQVMPVQLAVLALEGISIDELAASLRQSWSWPDAGEVAAHCRASLSLADFYAAGIDRRVRLALFHGALATLIDELPVRAVQWLPSQQVVAPDAYLAQLRAGEGLRGSAVNVRRFRMQSTEGAVHVMDTMGLNAFGLPDLQLRFSRLDPARAADFLFSQASALFEEGDRFLERGHVRGLDGDAELPFSRVLSSAGPERAVLDLDAGSYAPPSA